MIDVLAQAIKATPVLGTGGIQYKPENGSLEDFQAVVTEADRLSGEGIISIIIKHQDQQKGSRLVDGVQFVRLQ